MKNKFVPLVIISILFFGCSKDDDTSATYIGTWTAVNIEISACEDFTQDDFRAVQCTDNSCYRITFSEDGTYAFQQNLSVESGTWSASGVIITFCQDDEGELICKNGVGTLNSVGLTLSFTAETGGCVTSYIMEKTEEVSPADDEQ